MCGFAIEIADIEDEVADVIVINEKEPKKKKSSLSFITWIKIWLIIMIKKHQMKNKK